MTWRRLAVVAIAVTGCATTEHAQERGTIVLSALPVQEAPTLPPAPVAVASAPAVRTGPQVALETTQPPPTASPVPSYSPDSYNGRCVGAEPLLAYYSPGWDVVRMSKIMYRESRCEERADNASSTASGLLQILASHCGKWLAAAMGEPCSMELLKTADFNIRAARVLWNDGGYAHWAQTD